MWWKGLVWTWDFSKLQDDASPEELEEYNLKLEVGCSPWCFWPTSSSGCPPQLPCAFCLWKGKKGEACCRRKGGKKHLTLWRLDKCRWFFRSVIPEITMVYVRGRSQRDFLPWLCKEQAWCPAKRLFFGRCCFPDLCRITADPKSEIP